MQPIATYRPATPTVDEVRRVVAAFEATGRVAHMHPRLKQVSLNGGPRVSYAEGVRQMQQVVGVAS